MACESYFELLSARLDGELSPQEERALEEHLISCGECRTLAAQLEELHGILAALDEPAPEGLTERVLPRIQEETTMQRKTGRRRLLRWAAGMAACLAVCVGAWQLAHMPKSDGLVQPMMEEPDASMGSQARSGPAAYTLTPDDLADYTEDPACYRYENEQVIPLTWGTASRADSARILGSVESLEEFAAQFPENDLEETLAPYDAGFFAKRSLLAVVVGAGCSSSHLSIYPLGLLRDKVEIVCTTPEPFSADEARWLILAEVDSIFEDGDVLQVVVQGQLTP